MNERKKEKSQNALLLRTGHRDLYSPAESFESTIRRPIVDGESVRYREVVEAREDRRRGQKGM